MYLLELRQYNIQYVVGLFHTEADVKSWLHAIDQIKVRRERYDDMTFEDYYLNYEDLPAYQEVRWQNSTSILSRHSFSAEGGDILAVWHPIEVLSEVNGLVAGQTRVGAYIINNDEAQAYITALEELQTFLINHFKKTHTDVGIYGQGSEDGAYLMVDGHLYCHIEGHLVDAWQHKTSIEAFLADYINE